jgi:hypothetical protein
MDEFKHMRTAAFFKRPDGSVQSLGEVKIDRITETTEHIDPQSGVTVHLRRVVNGIVVHDGKPEES